MKINRNDPCPCGSGKKYKKCCLDKQTETTGPPNLREVMDEIRAKLEGQEFSSLEEVNAAMNQLTQAQNDSAITSFHGLSPSQMHRVLYFPFDSPELVKFAESPAAPSQVPALRLFALLVDGIGEKGLTPTATGNLPRSFCREAALAFWGEEGYVEHTRYGSLRTELDFFDMHCLRLTAELAGLVRKYKGKFVLTAECKKKIAASGVESVYTDLFMAYTQKFNWSYRDGFQEFPFLQQAFLFTLFLLRKYGGEFRPQAFYEDIFLEAFPNLLDEVEEKVYQTKDETLRRGYFLRTMENFAAFFGLAELRKVSEGPVFVRYEVKKLPLLDQFVVFAE